MSLKRPISLIELWTRNLKLRPALHSPCTATEKCFRISIPWQNKSTAIRAMTHSCTTKPNNQSLFLSAGAAKSEIDFEQRLWWLHATFPLRFAADDKHGRQVGPHDPSRAHIFLNAQADYPWGHTHTNIHTHAHTVAFGEMRVSSGSLCLALKYGTGGLFPHIPPGSLWIIKQIVGVCVD